MLKVNVTVTAGKERRADFDETRLLKRAGRYMVSSTISKISRTDSPPNAPLTIAVKGSSKPLRDTGALMTSINSRVVGNTAVVGTSRSGARLQQEGGTITPKKTAKLWIPASYKIRKELRANGNSITRMLSKYTSSGYRLFFPKTGKSVMARKGREKTLLFVLKKSVTVPARPFLYFSASDEAAIAKMLEGTIEKST